MSREPVDILEEAVRIPAIGDSLEGVLAYPFAGPVNRAALVIGPHPLMGGRLDNNVVRSVARGLAERGTITLRFRFGGAACSVEVMDEFWRTGHAPDDPRRADDAAAAWRWFRDSCRGPVAVIGYSFGASLLSRMVSDDRVSHLVLIGATLAQHDYAAVAASERPKLVIAAGNDFATPLPVTEDWYARARAPKRLVIVDAAEHFYRGQEPRLVEEIATWVQP